MKIIKSERLLLVLSGIILLVIVFAIIWFLFAVPNPTPSRQPVNNIISPTIKQQSQTTPQPTQDNTVQFDSNAQKKLLDKLIHRQQLSNGDASARGKILSLLPAGERSGTVFQSADIVIMYVQPVDEFQVEILTTNIQQAKAEAGAWFQEQGMSQNGICSLPLNFYPSPDVAVFLKTNKIDFSVLAEGC